MTGHRERTERCSFFRSWCFVLALLASCVSPPKPPAVEENGAELWRRIESEHFVVEGNGANLAPLHQVARDLETLWTAFSRVPVLGRRPPSTRPLVVVLRSKSEFHFVATEHMAGYFAQSSAMGPMIVMPAGAGAFHETVIKHELAHFVSSQFLPKAPQWLSEGLAQVMETAAYDTRKGEVIFGAHSAELVANSSGRWPSERFLAPWPEEATPMELSWLYARSWLLVHLLIDDHLPEFLSFLHGVNRGEDWRAAWRNHQLPAFEDLDNLLQRYHRTALYGLWRVAAPYSDRPLSEPIPVPLSDALALRALLVANSVQFDSDRAPRLDDARRDSERASSLDPSGERARRVAAAFQSREP
jgi:hypothetical protein